MKKFKLGLWVLAIFCVLVFSISPSIAANKPNVVVMMVDNLGWGELGVYGGGELRGALTPRPAPASTAGAAYSGLFQRIGLVGHLPGHVQVRASHVTVHCQVVVSPFTDKEVI